MVYGVEVISAVVPMGVFGMLFGWVNLPTRASVGPVVHLYLLWSCGGHPSTTDKNKVGFARILAEGTTDSAGYHAEVCLCVS